MEDLGVLTEWIIRGSGHGFRTALGMWGAVGGIYAASQGYTLGYILTPLALALGIDGIRGSYEFAGEAWTFLKEEIKEELKDETPYKRKDK